MATIINTPGNTADDSGSNLVLAVVLVVLIIGAAVLFFVYGLPMINNATVPAPNSINVNVQLPTTATTP